MGPYLSTLNYWRYWILGRGSHCFQLIPREEPTRLQWTALITPRVTESHRKTRLWGGDVYDGGGGGGGRELGKVGGVVIRVTRLHCILINT